MNRPRPKPKPAPAIEPHSRPIAATSSGDRSAGTPKIATCETVVSCRMPPTRPIGDEAGDGCGAPGHGVPVEARRSAVRLGQDLHEVEAAQVGGGRDVDRAVQLALALDALDACRSGSLRERRRQPVGDRARGDDLSPVRTSFASGTRSNSRSPGEPATGRIGPGWSACAASAETPKSVSESSITTALPSETVLTLPTRPLPLMTGWLTCDAVARALVDLDRRVPGRVRAAVDARGDRLVGVEPVAARRSRRGRAAPCSRSRTWRRATSWRSWSRSVSSSSRSPLASIVSPNQPNRSRNGLSARFAPSCTGATTSIAPVWTDFSGPPEDSPKYAVRRTRQHTTSANRTARRRRTCLSYIPGRLLGPARGRLPADAASATARREA